MTSEKFLLQWNDFQKNVTSSFKEIREDFCNVTLVGEDYKKIEAHKVVLAGSSNKLLELLQQSQHPHPLLYMKGIKGSHLSAVVDFMYHGEVSIAQDDLNDFLLVAEDLQLKGLAGTGEENNYEEMGTEMNESTKNMGNNFLHNHPFVPQNQKLQQTHQIDGNTKDDKFEVAKTNEADMKITTNNELLDETINSMMHKIDGIWKCTQCGKIDKDKYNLRNHIEANHLE